MRFGGQGFVGTCEVLAAHRAVMAWAGKSRSSARTPKVGKKSEITKAAASTVITEALLMAW